MIQTILIVLVAVVVLIVIIAVLALRYLRADDSDSFDDIPDEPRPARRPAEQDREMLPVKSERRPRQPEQVTEVWAVDSPARRPDARAPGCEPRLPDASNSAKKTYGRKLSESENIPKKNCCRSESTACSRESRSAGNRRDTVGMVMARLACNFRPRATWQCSVRRTSIGSMPGGKNSSPASSPSASPAASR